MSLRCFKMRCLLLACALLAWSGLATGRVETLEPGLVGDSQGAPEKAPAEKNEDDREEAAQENR